MQTHPQVRAGHRSTDADDLPAERTAYSLRVIDRLIADAASHGPAVGAFSLTRLAKATTDPANGCLTVGRAAHLLDHDLGARNLGHAEAVSHRCEADVGCQPEGLSGLA